MLYGLKWCASRGFYMAYGDTDSMYLTKCINKEWKPPRRIAKQVKDIHKLVKIYGFNIYHCYREANKPADKLAALSHGVNGIHTFNSFSELPRQVRGMVNMDRWSFQTFRVRHPKAAHIVYDPP
ncbi:hypothetical protein A4A49_54831 [Nicotiana attenuata]|uniref:RNase H type-1 domain-containing protein n=1 Tax=Nicotiana attenuata TaxID=49451 RepID=A0A314KTA8_NICAT|nr:hypothetical protein A4A49_54831 [Nicotiana attenuata]